MVDEQTGEPLELHLVMDNYAAHKHPKVRAWLAEHIATKSAKPNVIGPTANDIRSRSLIATASSRTMRLASASSTR